MLANAAEKGIERLTFDHLVMEFTFALGAMTIWAVTAWIAF